MATPSKTIKIGKYDVIDTIGRGGMGVVYLAKDPQLDRLVAIKMMNIDIHESSDFLERFNREAKATAGLQHPNIVTVYELGEHQGRPFLVMQYLEGNSLETLLRAQHPMSLLEKVNIVIEVCQGLAYAHQRRIIHRDIKPANIMVLNDGGVKIVDFGIARLGDHGMTRTGQIVGSLYYMPPEQIREQGVDTRADIYATGVVMYQLLTHNLPFEGESTVATLAKIISDEPPPFEQFGVTCPPELEAITRKALSKNREQRFPNAEALAMALSEVQDQFKQASIVEYMNKASLLEGSHELLQAQEYLLKVLKLDRQHTGAAKLLSGIRSQMQLQASAEKAAQLRKHAEQALAREDFDTALALISEAIGVADSAELRGLKVSAETAKIEAEATRKAVARAEAAQRIGDLDSAKLAIEEAIRHRPNDSKVKVLLKAILRDVEERDRQSKLESLLDEARKHMTSRNFTSALDLLREAQKLDPSAPQLRTLLEKLAAEHQREKHRRKIEQLTKEVQQAIDVDDYAGASSKAAQALQEFPNEPNLARLKEIADTQLSIAAQKVFVRGQIAAAEELLDAGQTQKALASVESALRQVGANARLESLRTMLRERLTKDLAEADKATCLQQANDAVGLGRYDDAVRILETAQVRFSESSGIDELLQFARDQQLKQRQQEWIEESTTKAQQLLAEHQFEEAVHILEQAVRKIPNDDLNVLLRQARNQLEAFQRDFKAAIEKGRSLLAEGSVDTANSFLTSRPAFYRKLPEFRELLQRAEATARSIREQQATARALREQEAAPATEGARSSQQRETEVAEDATQMFRSAPEPHAEVSEIPAAAKETRLFPTATKTKTKTGSHPVGGQPDREPPIPTLEPLEVPSRTPWLPILTAGVVLTAAIAVLVWWFTRPAYLVVTAPVGTEVALDGVSAQKVVSNEGISFKTSPGQHKVQVSRTGYESWSSPTLEVQRGEEKVLSPPELKATAPVQPPPPLVKTGVVAISSNVEGASVYVDRKLEDTFETSAKGEVHLMEGPHTIFLRKQGYEDSPPKSVTVSASGKENRLMFNLVQSKGASIPVSTDADLRVRAKPGASVMVDDIQRAVDPRGTVSVKLKPGDHDIRVNADGYLEWTTKVKLDAGQPKTISAVFKPKPQPPPVQPSQTYQPPQPLPTPPPTGDFGATPTTIQAGDKTSLRWKTQNAREVFLDGVRVAESGSQSVSPAQTTTYHLTATGNEETFTANVEVVVQPKSEPPPQPKHEPEAQPVTVSTNRADIDGVKSVLEKRRAAYQAMIPDGFKEFWPRISKEKLKRLSDEFNADKAISVTNSCPAEPSISGDTAEWTCEETKTHTAEGKRVPRSPHTVRFRFEKSNGVWYEQEEAVLR